MNSYVYDNKYLRESFIGFSPNQDEYPVMVYKGYAVRTGYEYRFKPCFYAGLDIFGKHLHYNDHEFKDEDRKDNMVVYKGSEKSSGHVPEVGHVSKRQDGVSIMMNLNIGIRICK